MPIFNAMAILEEVPFLQNKYIQTFLILIAFYIVSQIVGFILKRYVTRIFAKTKTNIDDLILQKVDQKIVWIIFLFGVHYSLIPLQLAEQMTNVIKNTTHSVMIAFVTYILIIIIDISLNVWGENFAKKTKSTIDDDVLPLLKKFTRIVFVILGFLTILSVWDVDVTGFLAGLGIAGIAIGFAVKDSLANIFGGIQLILDKAIKVGDVVQIGQHMGTITDVGLRSTRLKTWDNELIIIPNGQLANTEIQNYKLPDLSVRGIVNFGVEYGSNPQKVKDVVLPVLQKHKNIMQKKEREPAVQFLEMGESSLNFRATFWVETYSKKFQTKLDVTEQIYKALNKAEIGIPFPTRTIYTKKG